MIEVKIPPELGEKLGHMAETLVTTFRESTKFQHGPTLVVQTLFLVLLRIGSQQNPKTYEILQESLKLANEQMQAEMK